MEKQYKLKQDIYSGKRILYGKKGDKVTIVSQAEHVAIVERVDNKDRFPVLSIHLS